MFRIYPVAPTKTNVQSEQFIWIDVYRMKFNVILNPEVNYLIPHILRINGKLREGREERDKATD